MKRTDYQALKNIYFLYWDGIGFCLLYKRMEKGKFRFPKHITEEKYTVTDEELSWLLQGLHIEEINRYEILKYKKFSTRDKQNTKKIKPRTSTKTKK